MDSTEKVITISVCLLIAFAFAIYFLKGKFKKAEVRAGSISANISSHDPQRLSVDGAEQESSDGKNEMTMKTTDADIKNIKQKAKKDNILNIGNE